jgi:hypothetical protein
MNIACIGFLKTVWYYVKRMFHPVTLSLGSLHLTLMSAIGIWLWSSPYLFEKSQPHRVEHFPLSLECTSIAIVGYDVDFTSRGLRYLSLVIYSFFLLPGINLLVPVLVFLSMYIGFGVSSKLKKYFDCAWTYLFRSREPPRPGVISASLGLLVLLTVNVVFLANIELTIYRAKGRQEGGESEWSFGQTLALFLLSLPIRDVVKFFQEVRESQLRDEYTTKLKLAVENERIEEVRSYGEYADVRVATNRGRLMIIYNATVMMYDHNTGRFPSALQFAAYKGDLLLVELLVDNGAFLDVEGHLDGHYILVALVLMSDYRQRLRTRDCCSDS